MTSGYYRDELRTKELFDDDGFIRTGDVGMWTEVGDSFPFPLCSFQLSAWGFVHISVLDPTINFLQCLLIGRGELKDLNYAVIHFFLGKLPGEFCLLNLTSCLFQRPR